MCLQHKEKTKSRTGGKKMQKETRTKEFHMRTTPDFFVAMSEASKALQIGKSEMVERALAVFCPEYFELVGRNALSAGTVQNTPPSNLNDEGEKILRSKGGQIRS